MARPKKEKELERSCIITLRLTEQELENADTIAKRAGISRSELIRKLLAEDSVQVKYEIVADSELLRELVHQFGKIGTNLNQIALHYNTGGIRSMIMEDAVHEAIQQIFDMREEVLKLGGDYRGGVETYRKQKR